MLHNAILADLRISATRVVQLIPVLSSTCSGHSEPPLPRLPRGIKKCLVVGNSNCPGTARPVALQNQLACDAKGTAAHVDCCTAAPFHL